MAATYPGVYVEEVPGGGRTITGVATSITAFIGRALRGPVNDPTTINDFGDFMRRFGGLWVESMMSYAVKDFYQNGGSQAIIIRIEKAATASTINLFPTVSPPGDQLTLKAATKGEWGKNLKASIDYKTRDAGSTSPDTLLFNLKVFEAVNDTILNTETFLNVSVNPDDPRHLTRVLKKHSILVRVEGTVPAVRPPKTLVPKTPPTSPPSEVDNPIHASGGSDGIDVTKTEFLGSESRKTGIYALKKADIFNLLCIPPSTRGGDTDSEVYQKAMKLCADERAMLIVDPPDSWGANLATAAASAIAGLPTLGLTGISARNAALYFPRVRQPDPKRDSQIETFVPCGIVAGVMSRTDANRGVWKSPAGTDATLSGIQGLQVSLNDDENGQLNPLGINCLRAFPITGHVVWGARTLRCADRLADEYKYVAVRRTALFIEESLYRGTLWVVFEPNDEPLWAQIRLNIGAFMHNLFRQGAFQGSTAKQAYLVKCDKETTTQNDINKGIVNILIGFAPLKPAEFVIIKIQQLAGQTET